MNPASGKQFYILALSFYDSSVCAQMVPLFSSEAQIGLVICKIVCVTCFELPASLKWHAAHS